MLETFFLFSGSVPEIHTDSSRRKNIQGDMSEDTFIIRVRYRKFEHSCLSWTHDNVDDLLRKQNKIFCSLAGIGGILDQPAH